MPKAPKKRYNDLNTYLRGLFGCRVQKISVDAGLSCPNRDGSIATGGCIYCNARGSGTGAHARGLSVTDQLQEGKRRLGKRYRAKKFIAYFQSFSNTYAPLETLSDLYAQALGVPDIVGLSVGTRPDCISEPVLALLQGYAAERLVWMEYGLQSSCDATLARINRGHTAECFSAAVAATRGRGIKVCAHVILGLPGERRTHMLDTAKFITDLGIDGVKIHLLYVIRGTRMHHLYRNGSYTCLDQEEYVSIVCEFLELLPASMVIQRLTGDPHPNELVAPQWAREKTDTLRRIQTLLQERDTWQGKAVGANCP